MRPETGTVIGKREATITGGVDDPQAEVRLAEIEYLGGSVQSNDPENFSFAVPLEEGDNTFRLVATDKASNRSEEEIRLVRRTTVDLEITAPDPNATVTESPITFGRAHPFAPTAFMVSAE